MKVRLLVTVDIDDIQSYEDPGEPQWACARGYSRNEARKAAQKGVERSLLKMKSSNHDLNDKAYLHFRNAKLLKPTEARKLCPEDAVRIRFR